MFDLTKYSQTITNYAILYGIKIIIALFILIVGLWIIRRLSKLICQLMEKRGVDPSLIPFLNNIFKIGLRIMLIIVVISQVGIEATSFLAILGSAGIAIGLALQGSLSNFAGGVLLLTLRPFRVGDFIEAQGQSGKVHLINIFNTVIKTGDNKTIFIPNGPLANSTIINYDLEEKRRVDMKLIIKTESDVVKAREILNRLIAQDTRILKVPAPKVAVAETTQLAVTFLVRVWCHQADYWDIFYGLQDHAKEEFQKEGIL